MSDSDIRSGTNEKSKDQARGQFGQNNHHKGRNFALDSAQGEVGVSPPPNFFFFFRIFIKSFHKQAVMLV